MKTPVLFLLAMVAAPAIARAQDHDMHDMTPHARPFSQGPRTGWTTSAPHLDLDGGLYRVGAGSANREAFVRMHVQLGIGPRYLELAGDLLWVPAIGATPAFSGLVQLAPLREGSPFYASGGIGLVTGRNRTADRMQGWTQAVLAWRSPIHEITPFVQVGRALGTGQRTELLLGVAHPLAPYRLHIP